ALFVLAPGSRRAPAAHARRLALAFVAVTLAGLFVLRLLLAHRIDMMRDYEPIGARVAANEVYALLAGASLAAACAAVAAGRLWGAALAWAAVLAVGCVAIWPDFGAVPALAPQLAASLVVGSAPAWWRYLGRLSSERWLLVGLALVGVVAFAGHAVAPRAVAP